MAQSWQVDTSHSHVNFIVRHMVISKVRGRFNKWRATLDYDEGDPGRSRVDASIDVASIDTGEEKRDAHLRSSDFFDAPKYPQITFKSTRIAKKGRGWEMQGDLAIRGMTRPIVLEGTIEGTGKDPWGNQRVAFSAHGSIDRKDFGLTWNQALETGGVLVSDRVDIEIEVEAVKAEAKVP